MFRNVLILFGFSLVLASWWLWGRSSGSLDVKTPLAEKQRGVSWVAGKQIHSDMVTPLRNFNVNWMVQTPFGWQKDEHSPQVITNTGSHVFWGERDEGLIETARMARENGVKVLLKPHLWITRPGKGKWRTHIEMKTEEDWQAWFASYRSFILHYARLAESHGMEALCVGVELHTTAVQREKDWRQLIQEVRSVYSGKLVYAANWYMAYEEIKFWDMLDWIGIQAYFPLSSKTNPDLAELKQGWVTHRDAIQAVSRKYGKPVVFTEIGYRSDENAAVEPWVWPSKPQPAAKEDLETQVRCYESFFQTFWHEPWFAGAYIWKWFPASDVSPGHFSQNPSRNFTPQFKPAQEVLLKWYGKE